MIRRNALVLGLYFLAPFVAEFLLGNLPIVSLPAIFVLAPLYGGGAILIRELVRRRGLGWVNIVILAVAYGVLEEGLTTQSLFNPNYAGQHLLVDGYVPALGIAVPWTMYVVGIHVFWSICAPIMLMEVFAGERRTTPWLGNRGLIITAVLFAIGIAGTAAINMKLWPYTATAGQFAGTGVVLAVLIAAGLLLRIRFAPRAGRAPGALAVFVATLVGGALFQSPTVVNMPTWVGVGVVAAGVIGFLALLAYWSTGAGWSNRQYLAIAAGALLTYAWHSFTEWPVGGAALAVKLTGNVLCTAAAVALILWARRAERASATEVQV